MPMSSWIDQRFRHFAPHLPVWAWPILVWSLWRVWRWLEVQAAHDPGLSLILHCTGWGEVWAETFRAPDTSPNRAQPYADDGPWYLGAPARHCLHWKGMGLATDAGARVPTGGAHPRLPAPPSAFLARCPRSIACPCRGLASPPPVPRAQPPPLPVLT
ncbi:MAG: hypothetical protein AAFR00_13240 [Pseudomonadota bacterium]